jgi:hypothetical protein
MTEQPGPPFEERKYGHDLLREDAHRAHDNSDAFHTYTNQAAIESSNIALKTLIVINGGAAIAVLTFLGGVASKDKIDFATVAAVAYTIRYFAFGVASAMAAMAFSYLTHYFMTGIEGSRVKNYTHPFIVDGPGTPRMRLLNRTFHIAAVAAAFLSLLLFMIGMYAASDKIAHMLVK